MTVSSKALCLAALSLFWLGLPANITASSKALAASPTIKKHFSFPSEFAIGNLHLADPSAPRSPGEITYHNAVINARGSFDFPVPTGNLVVLKLGSKGVMSPQAVLKSDPTNIDCLAISYLSIDAADEKVTSEMIKVVPHFPKLKGLFVDRSDAQDSDLVVLKNLPLLTYLSVFMTTVNGDFLKYLPANSDLAGLQMGHIPLVEAKLAPLGRLKKLKSLFFSHTNVGAVGAGYIAQCANLETLSVSDSRTFDDKALALLKPLKHLTVLRLEGSRITVPALCALKGMPLLDISISRHLNNPANLAAIRAAFPKAVVVSSSHKVDSENTAIFAPLH